MAKKTSNGAARIEHVPAPTAHGYRWLWRSNDGAASSSREFNFFFDCLSDARAHGFQVELAPPPSGLMGHGELTGDVSTDSRPGPASIA